MRKWSVRLLGILIILVSILGYWYYTDQRNLQVSTITTLVPSRTLQAGEILEASMINQVVIPAAQHRVNAIRERGQLEGKIVTVALAPDEEFVPWKISDVRLAPTAEERYFSFKTDTLANVGNMVRKADRVDVWIEFEKPRSVHFSNGQTVMIGAMKIIDSLPVVSVKTAEGVEVSDDNSLVNMIVPANARSRATGKPESNTYLMAEDVYQAYVMGSTVGKIKLALPNLSNNVDFMIPASTTDTYTQFYNAGLFSTVNNLEINGVLKNTEVKDTSKQNEPQSTSKGF